MRGGKHSTWERNMQCQNALIYYPPGHTGRSVPPPTYWLVLKLRNVPCSEHLDFFDLFIGKTELKWWQNTTEYISSSQRLKMIAHNLYPKKCLHLDLNAKAAYGKELEQCLFSTRWRGMCKKPKPSKKRQLVVLLLTHVNAIENLSFALLWLGFKAQPASFSQGHFLPTLMTGTPAPVMLFVVSCPVAAERGYLPCLSHTLLRLPCISFKL